MYSAVIVRTQSNTYTECIVKGYMCKFVDHEALLKRNENSFFLAEGNNGDDNN